jgi:hypothetical protein
VSTANPARSTASGAATAPNGLVGAAEDVLGLELDHYVEVAIPSFLEIVDAPAASSSAATPPCETPSLAPTSRRDATRWTASTPSPTCGRDRARADFARVERQQRFLSALADRAASLPMLANPVRLRDLATSVADGLVVDDDLDIARMADLAASLSELLDSGIDAYTLPAYARTLDDAASMVAHRPGVQALGERLTTGRPSRPGRRRTSVPRPRSPSGPTADPARRPGSKACSTSPATAPASPGPARPTAPPQ